MQYIVLDMEWNQAWPGTYAARKAMELPLHGEVIQIGAVRVTETKEVADEFQVLIRPKLMKKLNRKISSMTGITEAMLREKGVPLPVAIEAFRAWCGEDCVFLIWGFDDIRILKENLLMHHLDYTWTEPWYNAQMIFNAQTDGTTSQKSLKTAMEIMEIPASRPAHDALGDAYHTALVCARLDLAGGVARYGESLEKHENGFHGATIPDCLDRRVFKGYADKDAAMAAMEKVENTCPKCGGPMKAQRWISQPGHRYMTRMSCRKCGGFLVRIRLQQEEDGTIRVGRLLYTGNSEAAGSYDRQLARRVSSRHRRRKKKEDSK